MKYSDFLEELKEYAEQDFAIFQERLIPTKTKILGVRTPIMRTLAKKYLSQADVLFSYPNKYFEVVFIKLAIVCLMPYEKFVGYLDDCVALMDNWAFCDCFKAKGIKEHKEEFLTVLEKLFSHGGEFYERYVLVVLLSEYVEEKYMERIFSYLCRANTQRYYVHMATAWLTAEVLIKYYERGLEILQSGILDEKTHNKAIQKALESYRITKERKEYLRSLKIKKTKV